MARFDSTRFEVWCEDRAQEQFARELLTHLGAPRKKISFNVAPRGRGAASDWVLEQYRVVRHRARAVRNSQPHLGFLVVIDGDDAGCAKRKVQLDAKGGPRDKGDRIAQWVPTWSIENVGAMAVRRRSG